MHKLMECKALNSIFPLPDTAFDARAVKDPLALFAAIERAYNTFGADGESPSPASAALLQAAHFALLGALIVADAPAPFAAPDRPRAD